MRHSFHNFSTATAVRSNINNNNNTSSDTVCKVVPIPQTKPKPVVNGKSYNSNNGTTGKNENPPQNTTEKSVRFGLSEYITGPHNGDVSSSCNGSGDSKPASSGDSPPVKGILKTNLDANMMSLLLDSEDGTPV